MEQQNEQDKCLSRKTTPDKYITNTAQQQSNKSISSLMPDSERETQEKFIHIDKRKRKRSISRKVGFLNDWSAHDAKKAIQLEQKYVQRDRKAQTLIISFPDESIRPKKVLQYSANIEKVKFFENVAQRYCHVRLKPDVDAKAEIAKISKIPFQNGFLRAKLHPPRSYEPAPLPLEVDPTTLYLGNLPVDTFIADIRKLFKNAIRIDMGYSLKSKWRRYALVKFRNAVDASKAFETCYDSHIRQQSLVVRFHRVKNWEVLKKAEILNELEEIRVKKQQIDADYDKALQRAKSMVPAYIPFAQPFIVKQEPESSSYEEEADEPATNATQNQNQHDHNASKIHDSYDTNKVEEEPQNRLMTLQPFTDPKSDAVHPDSVNQKRQSIKASKETEDAVILQTKANSVILERPPEPCLTKSIFDVEDPIGEPLMMDAPCTPKMQTKKRKSTLKPFSHEAEKKRSKFKDKLASTVQKIKLPNSTFFN